MENYQKGLDELYRQKKDLIYDISLASAWKDKNASDKLSQEYRELKVKISELEARLVCN